jgi:hypothetical protein
MSRVTSSDGDRAAAFSLQLRRAHQELQERLSRIRGQLGQPAVEPAGLQVRCLAFCSALTAHHRGEDEGMFSELLAARPDLAPAIRKLIDDHEAMAGLVRQVQDLAARAVTVPADGLPRLRRELDGLTAITESHFRYEERALGAALDAGVADTGWSVAVFTPAEPPGGHLD